MRINEKLLKEGEKLFASVGLRKITIDNLTEIAGFGRFLYFSDFIRFINTLLMKLFKK